MKPISRCGDSQSQIRVFPEAARRKAGHELNQVQHGREPEDWKPMPSVGVGVNEIRVHVEGAYRVLYAAKFEKAVYVLHAFRKKTRRTPKQDSLTRGRALSFAHRMAQEGAAVSKRMKIVRGSGNVFRDLGFSETEARNLSLRSELMIRIEQFVESSGLTQARAAQRLGLTQPRLNALLRGKIDLFSLDALVTIATRAGLSVELRVSAAKPARHSATAAP